MKKLLKRIVPLILSFIFIIGINSTNAFAAEEALRMGPTIYKKNVRTTSEWGSFKRVGNNMTVRKGETHTFTVTQTVTFGTTVIGTIDGLGINTSSSISSTLGHSISTSNPGTWYLAFRVKYNVEKGTRVYVSGVDSTKVIENSYTVKKPIYGEYKLIKVR